MIEWRERYTDRILKGNRSKSENREAIERVSKRKKKGEQRYERDRENAKEGAQTSGYREKETDRQNLKGDREKL